ncbi:MAG TPA: hypothetical protein PK303_07465 [bacterium]|nr:hypothetical protein [bacterium]HPP08940.1 hypothetical protein [bacterium]
MRTLSLLVLFLFQDLLLCQIESIWERQYDNSGNADIGWAIAEAPDKGFVIVGASGPSKILGTRNNYQGLVIKTDSEGNVVKMKTFGGNGQDLLSSVVCNGTYFIAAGSKIEPPYKRQGWIIKFDSDLNLLWEKTFGGKQDDSFSQIINAGDKNFFLIGETKSYGKKDGRSDVYLVQIDDSGNLKWQQTYDLGSSDIGTSIAQLKDGKYIITAVSSTKNPGTLLQEGFCSYIVINQDGTIVKQRKFMEGKKNKLLKVKAISDGGAILVGTTSMLDKFPSEDTWIVRLNENCDVLWSKIIPSQGRYDGAFDVVEMDSVFIVVGYSQVHQSEQMNFDNFAVNVVDKNGNVLDHKEWGFQDNDDLYGIIRLGFDTVVIVGFKNAVSWPLTKIPGNSDIYLIKMKYNILARRQYNEALKIYTDSFFCFSCRKRLFSIRQ